MRLTLLQQARPTADESDRRAAGLPTEVVASAAATPAMQNKRAESAFIISNRARQF